MKIQQFNGGLSTRLAPQIGSVKLVMGALSPTKAATLTLAKQNTVREIGPLLNPLNSIDATQEQWDQGMNYFDRVLLNMGKEYNMTDANGDSFPVVTPEHVVIIMESILGSQNYQKFVPKIRQDRHQDLLRLIRPNFEGKPRAEKAFQTFIKEEKEKGWFDSVFPDFNSTPEEGATP